MPFSTYISNIKKICEQNQIDRMESFKIFSSLIALSQLQSANDEETELAPVLKEKSMQTYQFLCRQIHRVSMTVPPKDQITLNTIQGNLKDYLFSNSKSST